MTSWLDLEQKRFRPIQDYFRRWRIRMTAYLEESAGRTARVSISFPHASWATEEAENLFVEAAKKGGWMLKEDEWLKSLSAELKSELESGTSPLEWWIKATVLLTDHSFIDKDVCCDPPDDICVVRWKILRPVESSLELCEKLNQMAQAAAEQLCGEWAAEIAEEQAKKQAHAPTGDNGSVSESSYEHEAIPSTDELEEKSSEGSGRGRPKDDDLATITEYLHRGGIRSPADLKYRLKLRRVYVVMDEDGIEARGGAKKWVDLLDKPEFKDEGKRVKDALRKYLGRIQKKA